MIEKICSDDFLMFLLQTQKEETFQSMEERSNSKQNLINRISRRGLIQKKIKDILSIDQMNNSKQKDILLGQIIKDIL